MPHIHTEHGGHDTVMSAFIIRTDTPEPTIMMHVHKKLNVYLQFGGHVETTENPWQTLVHEIEEESGYEIGQLKVLQPKNRIKVLEGVNLHPLPFLVHTHDFDGKGKHFHSDSSIALVTDQAPKNKPGEGEVQDIKLLTLEEIEALPEGQVFENTKAIAKFLLEEILPNWEETTPSEFS